MSAISYHHLFADLFLEDVLRVGGVSAGIHYREGGAAPLALTVMAVAGDSGRLVDDGLAHAYKAVEKGRFTYVGSSYYGY